MPSYRIFRLKPHLRQGFRAAPHLSGLTQVKPRDYQEEPEVREASTPYALWGELRDTENPLEVGDILDSGETLCIVKYVGFETAQWVVPEAKPVEDTLEQQPAPVEPVER